MTDIQWGLQDPNSFQRGFQQSKGMFDEFAVTNKKHATDNALRQYALNPNDPSSINALAKVDPSLAIQARDKQASYAETQRKAHADILDKHRENIVRGAQIVRQVQPKDQAGWDQALQTAQQLGIDVSELPRDWNDPKTQQFATGLIAAADAFEPQKPESSPYQVVAGQPGAGVYRFDKRGGTMTELVHANDGSGIPGAPVAAHSGPQPGTIEDGFRFKGGDPAKQENWEPVAQGGQTPPASGVFRS